MKVVIFSCDTYSWLVPIFLHFYRKNWSDNPYQTVIVTETIKAEGVDTFCAGKIPWSDRAIKYLESINEKRFLLFLEEYILNERVDNDKIRRAADLCGDAIGCVRLFTNDYPVLRPFLVDSKIDGFKEYLLDKPYSLSHQASIWQKEFFLELLQKGENNWQAEVNGSKRIHKFGKKVIWNDIPALKYHKCGYMDKGKIVKSEEEWAKENW